MIDFLKWVGLIFGIMGWSALAAEPVSPPFTLDLSQPKGILQQTVAPNRPLVTVAFSGGIAKGLTHIGVIRAFEDYHIPIDRITGTSMGGVIGGLHALGYSADDIEAIAHWVPWETVFLDLPERRLLYFGQKKDNDRNLLEFRFKNWRLQFPSGLSEGQEMRTRLTQLTIGQGYKADFDFSRAPIPFQLLATDLNRGRAVVLERGYPGEMMRASSAFPIAFTPVQVDSLLLADGGLLENLPTRTARKHPGLVIGVDLASDQYHPNPQNIIDLTQRTIAIMAQSQTQELRELADVLIHPNVDEFDPSDWRNLDTLMTLGYQAVVQALPAIRKKVTFIPPDTTLLPPLPQVTQIQIHGNKSLSTETIKEIFPTRPFQPTRTGLKQAVNQIERRYHERGWVLAHVDSLDVDSTGTLWIVLDEGRIGEIALRGNQKTRNWIITREVKSTPGDLFHLETVIRDINRIYSLGLFDNVKIEIEKIDPPGNIRLIFVVKERADGILRFGLRADRETSASALVEVGFRNFAGFGGGLFMTGRMGRIQDYRITYRMPRVGKTNFTLNPTGYYHKNFYYDYPSPETRLRFFRHTWGFDLPLGYQIRRVGRLELNYRLRRIHYADDSPRYVSQRPKVYNSWGVNLTYDSLDRNPYPRRGSSRQLEYEAGTGGEYHRWHLHFKGYWTPLPPATVIAEGHAGVITGAVPYHVLFQAGEEDFLPAQGFGQRIGRYYRAQNIGLRLALRSYNMIVKKNLYLFLWFTAADFYPKKEDVYQEGRSIMGGQVGLHLDTVLGPVKLDYAWDETRADRWYFAIGYSF
ncbi:MAG: hypothetical protein D6675_00870 [Gemmatimonadetes bacterium]|nr:MAG: hypothetical protein D6675_00870 [Gemmatimonadota bacterium]